MYRYCSVCGFYVAGVVELYNKRGQPLPVDRVLQIFYQVCCAVQHMHNRQTPVIHRDLKVILSATVTALFARILLSLQFLVQI